MKLSLLVLFGAIALAAALPFQGPPPSFVQIAGETQIRNEAVSTPAGVVRVIFIIFMATIVIPIIHYIIGHIFFPFNVIKYIVTTPVRVISSIISLPSKIISLPKTIITLPVRFVLMVVALFKKVFAPFVAVANFIINSIAFIMGVPVRAFSTRYIYV